jgi:hypothetical protein
MTNHDSDLSGHGRRPGVQPWCPAPNFLPAFPNAVRVRPRFGRTRWRDHDGSLFEWESHDGALEKYGVHGWHLGEYDHVRGGNLKVAEPGRKIQS